VVAPTPVSLLARTDIDIIDWALDQGNLITAMKFFSPRNAYHPFAQCSYPQKHSDLVPLTQILQKSAGTATVDRKTLHYCLHHVCAGLDTDNFRSNRKEVNNMDFLDKSKKNPCVSYVLR